MKLNYRYNIIIDDTLNLRKNLIEDKIESVLNDPRGWRKLGYKFHRSTTNLDFVITIVPNKIVKKVCNFDGLSCATMFRAKDKTDIIFLNLEKWQKGSAKSKQNLDGYRTYLINHECAHILGKGHIKLEDCKSGIKCPVMVQQTLGIGNLKPNCWPTKMDSLI
jgi:hypothetical protein